MSFCHFVIVIFRRRCLRHLVPAVMAGLADPTVTLPSGDNLDERVAGRVVTLHGSQVFERECRRQLVEDRLVLSVSLAIVTGHYILTHQCFAESLDLLHQTVVSHHQGKVEASLRFLGAATQQVEDDPAMEY